MAEATNIAVIEGKDDDFIAWTFGTLNSSALALGRSFDGTDLQIRATDADGTMVGGLFAQEILGWLFIKYLVVAEASRDQGIGGRLLARAEEEARRLKLSGVYLDTYEFQSPRFYLREGYQEIGRLPEVGDAPTRIWFAKTF